jgi:hypothetical protein
LATFFTDTAGVVARLKVENREASTRHPIRDNTISEEIVEIHHTHIGHAVGLKTKIITRVILKYG